MQYLFKQTVVEHPIEKRFSSLTRYHFFLYFFLFTAKVPMFWQVVNLIFLSPTMTYTCKGSKIVNQCPCKEPVWDKTIFTKTLQTKFNLICKKKSLVGLCHSLLSVGSLIGSFIFGAVSDKMGRLATFCLTITLMGIFGTVVAFMPNVYAYMVVRVLQGLGIGGGIITGYVLCVEYCGKSKQRELISALYHIPLNIGHMTLPGISYYLRDCDYYQVACSAPVLIFGLLIFIAQESPKWLCDSGKLDRAAKAMERIGKFNNTDYGDVKAEMQTYLENRPTATKEQFWHIFRYRRLVINFFTMTFIFFSCGMGYYGVSQYIGQMSGNVHLNVALSGSVLIPATLLSILLFHVLSRKTFLILSSIFSGAFLISVIFMPTRLNTLKVVFACIGNCFIWMAFIVVFLYAVELFPTSVRNSALGFLSVCARFGQIIAPLINDLNPIISGCVFGVCAIIAGVLSLILPETKGKSLPSRLADLNPPRQ